MWTDNLLTFHIDVYAVVELTTRPNIRVLSRLYSGRTIRANEKAMTSWSNRSNELLVPGVFNTVTYQFL